jgi:hypothetical protein
VPKSPICPRCGKRPRHRNRTYCKKCEATRARKYYRGHKKQERARVADYRERHPDRVEDSRKRHRESEKGQRVRREYRLSEKGKKHHKRYAQSARGRQKMQEANARYRAKIRGLTAKLPTEVVQPFVIRMVKDAELRVLHGRGRGGQQESGITRLADICGLKKEDVNNIFAARVKSVKVEVADKLAMHGDFTLMELYDRAAEWAQLTGSDWPNGDEWRRKRSPSPGAPHAKRREQITEALTKNGRLSTPQLAKVIGVRPHSGASSKHITQMLNDGLVRWSTEPGSSLKYWELVEQ